MKDLVDIEINMMELAPKWFISSTLIAIYQIEVIGLLRLTLECVSAVALDTN